MHTSSEPIYVVITNRRWFNCSFYNKIFYEKCNVWLKNLHPFDFNTDAEYFVLDCHLDPCQCPFSDCKFSYSSEKLYKHMDSHMPIKFNIYSEIALDINPTDAVMVLKEENEKRFFVLGHRSDSRGGRVLQVTCVGPAFSEA